MSGRSGVSAVLALTLAAHAAQACDDGAGCAAEGAIVRAGPGWLPAPPVEAASAGVEVRMQAPEMGQTGRTETTALRDVDMRLWLRSGPAAVGAGLSGGLMAAGPFDAQALSALGSGPMAVGSRAWVVGVRFRLNQSSGLYADHVGAGTRLDGTPASLGTALNSDRALRVGLEFKAAKSHLSGLPQGSLFRVQLSSDSNLSIRPRKGGLAFMLRAQW